MRVSRLARFDASLYQQQHHSSARAIRNSPEDRTSPCSAPTSTLAVPPAAAPRVVLTHPTPLPSNRCLARGRISEGDDNEKDFAVALVKSAFERPSECGSPQMTVHFTGPKASSGTPAFSKSLQSTINDVEKDLLRVLAIGQEVTLVGWPEGAFLERYLIGGMLTEMDGRKPLPSSRWGVHLGHVALRRDRRRPRALDIDWHLLDRDRRDHLSRRYVTGDFAGCLPPTPKVVRR